MTTHVSAASPEKRTPHPTADDPSASVYAIVVGAIAVVQGVVTGSLGLAGFFYLDDIDMTAEGAKHPFNWDYVSLGLNDHFSPGSRAIYWAIAHFAPYDNGATVAGRVLVQCAATLLMGYLLALLVGPGRLAMTGVALYAFSPLLVPSVLSLSSAVHVLPTHVSILVLTIMHVRFEVTRRYRYAVIGALGLLLGLMFWERAVIGLTIPVLLTCFYLNAGPLRARLGALLRDWGAWLIYLLPAVAFFCYYLTGGYVRSLVNPTVGSVWTAVRESWVHSIGPTVVGGPWDWITTDIVYYGYIKPGPLVTLLGQAALLTVMVVGVRRHGWTAIKAWLIFGVYLIGAEILFVAGRWGFFGVWLTRNLHYYSELSIPLVLSIVLCIGHPATTTVRARAVEGLFPDTAECGQASPRGTRVSRLFGIGAVLVVIGYAASYGVTVWSFERRWVQNPIREYMQTASRDIAFGTAARAVSVYDTFVPGEVASLIQNNRRVSDIFRPLLTDLKHPVLWDDSSGPMYVFDLTGNLTQATLTEEAVAPAAPGVLCPYPLRGMATVTLRLDHRITRPDGFLVLDYLSRSRTSMSIVLADGATSFAPRRNGNADLVAGQYAAVVLGTPGKAFDQVAVTSHDPYAEVCLSARAGYPVSALMPPIR
jgi:hypothetical protein